MKFKDLEEIELVWYEPENSIKKLKEQYGLSAPESVIEQFYIDHRDKEEFIDLYGHLDLHKLNWCLKTFDTSELINIGSAATHPEYVEEISKQAKYYPEWGVKAIDLRTEVSDHWLSYGTWLTPPIFIKGSLMEPKKEGIQLVEGHTRLGCLSGLVKYKPEIVAENHSVYFGS